MADGRVLYAHSGNVHVLRYVGDIRYPLTPTIDNFVDQLFRRERVRELVIDLSETDSIDSTNLGELARIANRVRGSGGERPVIVCPRPDVDCVLRSMAMDEVFDLSAAPTDLAGEEQPLPTATGPRSPSALRHLMLEAHRTLMDMSEENRARFFDVVALMEGRDPRREDARRPPLP